MADAYKNIKVTARPPSRTGIPFATEANACAVLNAFGDIKGKIAFLVNMTPPAAITARVFDHAAFAATTMASSLDSKKALLSAHRSLSVTRAACYWLSALFGTTAITAITSDGAGDGNLF